MARPTALALVAFASLLAFSPAQGAAQRGHTVMQSRYLWATINVCNTSAHPDAIGVRASMPGSGHKGESMFMRFQVQYFSRADKHWHNIAEGADSSFIAVGSARFRSRQAGWTFKFEPPTKGASNVLRGVVTYEWRRNGEVVRRARTHTTRGHRVRTGSDPPGFSASVCEISS